MNFKPKSIAGIFLAVLMVITMLPFTAFAEERTLSVDKTEYTAGEAIMVTATGTADEWVGIYLKDDNIGPVASIRWYGVLDHRGQSYNGIAFNIKNGDQGAGRDELYDLPAGDYKIVLFADGGYTAVQQIDIKIVDNENPASRSLATDKAEYTEGETVMVTASGIGADWVGIYLKNDTVENGTDKSIYWYNVADHNGAAFDITKGEKNSERQDLFGLPAGEYKVVLCANGGYDVVSQVDITITKNAVPAERSLVTDKTEYTEGETVMVTASGIGADWVGIYLKNDMVENGTDKSIYWYNVADHNGASFDITKGENNSERQDLFGLPAGEYKVVLCANGGYDVVSQVDITITKNTAPVERSLVTDKTEYKAGEPVMVTASGTGSDWVGIYLKDDVVDSIANGGVESIYWYDVKDHNGESFDISKGKPNKTRSDLYDLPAGEYKVVLCEDGLYTVAKQVDITITGNAPVVEKTITTDKDVYEVGEPIMVTATGTAKDWAGIYLKNDGVDPDNGGKTSVYWYYVADGNPYNSGDSVDISKVERKNDDRSDLFGLPAGEYKVVLLGNDGYGVLAEKYITIRDHKYTVISHKDATCTEPGLTVSKCDYCSNTIEETVKPLGHDLGEFEVTQKPNCTEAGVKTAKCSRCDYTETESIPALGHHNETVIIKPATCTQAGQYKLVCDVCGYTDSKVYASSAIEHKYTITSITLPTCTVKGKSVYKCMYCGHSYTEWIKATGHGKFVTAVTVKASCTKAGKSVEKCIDCGYVRSTKTINKLAHKYGKATTVKPTSTKVGYTQKKCSVCGTVSKSNYKLSKMAAPKLSSNSTSSIKITYSKVTGASGYDIYVSTTKKHYYTNKTSYTFSKLSAGKAYSYKIRPYVTVNGKKVYGEYSSYLKTGTKPKKVTLSKVTSPKSKQLKITWKKLSASTGYQVQYSTSSKFTAKTTKSATVSKNSTTSKTVKKLKGKKKYYARVRAYKTVNGKKIYGAWSSVKSVKTKK